MNSHRLSHPVPRLPSRLYLGDSPSPQYRCWGAAPPPLLTKLSPLPSNVCWDRIIPPRIAQFETYTLYCGRYTVTPTRELTHPKLPGQNAVILSGAAPSDRFVAAGPVSSDRPREIGAKRLTAEAIERMKGDLKVKPPQPFDIA